MSEMVGVQSLAVFAICSFISAIIVTGAWAVQSFVLRCKASKWLDYAHRGNYTLAFIFKSNHVTKMVPCKVHANGYLETLAKGRGEPKHFIPILRNTFSKPTVTIDPKTGQPTEDSTQSIKEATEIAMLEREILTPTAIEGTNCRAYLVYDGVACAVTAEALLGLGVPEQAFQFGVSPQCYLDVCLPVHPPLVKKHLTKLYDQSTVDGYGQDRWQEGWAARGKSMDGNIKFLFLAGFLLIICGAALMVASFFL